MIHQGKDATLELQVLPLDRPTFILHRRGQCPGCQAATEAWTLDDLTSTELRRAYEQVAQAGGMPNTLILGPRQFQTFQEAQALAAQTFGEAQAPFPGSGLGGQWRALIVDELPAARLEPDEGDD